MAYEAREKRFYNEHGWKSHIFGGTIEIDYEAAAAATLARSLKSAAAYEAAEKRFIGSAPGGMRFVGPTSHLDGGTIDAPAEEQARSAAVTRALKQAAAYEGADASGEDGTIDWSKVSTEQLEKLRQDSKAGIEISTGDY